MSARPPLPHRRRARETADAGGVNPPGAALRSVLGVMLPMLGAVALIVAYTVLDWYRHDAGDGPSHLSDVRAALNELDALHAANGVASAYFGWLAWVLLVLVAVCAILANLPGAGATLLRALAIAGAVAGIVLTFLAIELTAGARVREPIGYGDYLGQARLGFYLTLAGYALMAGGALIGVRRQ